MTKEEVFLITDAFRLLAEVVDVFDGEYIHGFRGGQASFTKKGRMTSHAEEYERKRKALRSVRALVNKITMEPMYE